MEIMRPTTYFINFIQLWERGSCEVFGEKKIDSREIEFFNRITGKCMTGKEFSHFWYPGNFDLVPGKKTLFPFFNLSLRNEFELPSEFFGYDNI